MLQTWATTFTRRHLQMHFGSEKKVKAVLLVAMAEDNMWARVNLANVHFVSLQNSLQVYSGNPSLSSLTTTVVDYMTQVSLAVQCFIMLSPSGSDFILLQDYSDSSMQICFSFLRQS